MVGIIDDGGERSLKIGLSLAYLPYQGMHRTPDPERPFGMGSNPTGGGNFLVKVFSIYTFPIIKITFLKVAVNYSL